MQISFFGASRTVTGSKYLITTNKRCILVDCGLFQGYKELRLRNWNPLPFDPKKLDAVVLTHAHIDHSGYLPLLVKQGFSKNIYSSKITQDLCEILLLDSAHLQEEQAKLTNQYHFSKHHPALPLYTSDDAKHALTHFHALNFGVEYTLSPDLTITLHRAGHILGASLVLLKNQNTSLLFSGDLGRASDIIMKPPAIIETIDYLVLESTYGDSLHDTTDPLDVLEKIIQRTIKRGGTVLIPAFAVGRAQSILYLVHQLQHTGRIPPIPVYLDSPMAVKATELFAAHASEHRLSKHLAEEVYKTAIYVDTLELSSELDVNKMPKIIISASGMATGGRILKHLIAYAPDSRNTVLITGFQAPGTRGDRIMQGEKSVKVHGKMLPINAEVASLTTLSAHADSAEIMTWLSHFKQPPRKVFITHGEPAASFALKAKIEKALGWTCVVPEYLQEEEIL